MKVREVMTPDPACCAPRATLVEAARLMARHDCGAIPVVEDGRPVGVVTDRDIVLRAIVDGRDPSSVTAADVMTQPVASVSREASLEDCCEQMEQRQVRRIVVVDEDGRCCGIVAQADVARRASERQSGEVVKEISQPA